MTVAMRSHGEAAPCWHGGRRQDVLLSFLPSFLQALRLPAHPHPPCTTRVPQPLALPGPLGLPRPHPVGLGLSSCGLQPPGGPTSPPAGDLSPLWDTQVNGTLRPHPNFLRMLTRPRLGAPGSDYRQRLRTLLRGWGLWKRGKTMRGRFS